MMRPAPLGLTFLRCLAVHAYFTENSGVLPRASRRPPWLRDTIGALMVLALSLLLPMIAYVVMGP